MKKRVLWLIAIVFILAFQAGCQRINQQLGVTPEAGIDQSTYEQIHKRLMALTSYRSEATVTYLSNRGANVYETLHECLIDGRYRIEVTGPSHVAGSVTVSDGSVISQFNPRVSGHITVGMKETPERSEIFLTSFIRNYMASESVSVSVGSFGEGTVTVLEAAIPGNHPYLASGRLWVDNTTLNPVKLTIYDSDMSERIVVSFNTFEYNIPLDDSLFVVPQTS